MIGDIKDIPPQVLSAIAPIMQWALANGLDVDGGVFIQGERFTIDGINHGDWRLTLTRTKKP
jgi:hypothetical protein